MGGYSEGEGMWFNVAYVHEGFHNFNPQWKDLRAEAEFFLPEQRI